LEWRRHTVFGALNLGLQLCEANVPCAVNPDENVVWVYLWDEAARQALQTTPLHEHRACESGKRQRIACPSSCLICSLDLDPGCTGSLGDLWTRTDDLVRLFQAFDRWVARSAGARSVCGWGQQRHSLSPCSARRASDAFSTSAT
jgi:hypothetical protein